MCDVCLRIHGGGAGLGQHSQGGRVTVFAVLQSALAAPFIGLMEYH